MPKALDALGALPGHCATRIFDKMDWFMSQRDPLRFGKPLKGSHRGSYRFRIGDYRVIVQRRQGNPAVIEVLAILHRREAYRL
ncbi:MAG: type II toxin-antitoxin system RelE/ParE family toxin [Candidatus Peribacteraceae bacterium]|nr:type II toxin-antitoxin system RelE/ParE family toxin [Candidatus Peribacteraceae bacterium]